MTALLREPMPTPAPPLLPCPFCGSSDVFVDHVSMDDNAAFVHCRGCGTEGPFDLSEEVAIAAWNHRLSIGSAVFADIAAERERQNATFPHSNIPYWKDDEGIKFTVLVEEVGEVARARLEHDRPGLRHELVQVAAVAVAWIEALDATEGQSQLH
jgi:Lar family restriction alleviation protein